MAETLSVQLKEILDAYEDRVNDVMGVAIDRVARESVRRLRQTSPKKSGSYAHGWTVKRMNTSGLRLEMVVHNKNGYQLTHLLENGYRIVNAKGEWGRTNGIKHIKPVEEWANEELPKEIERELE